MDVAVDVADDATDDVDVMLLGVDTMLLFSLIVILM